MNQEKQYSDPLPRRLSSDPLKQETDWTDERPAFAAQAELIRHLQAASPPSPLLAIQRNPVSAARGRRKIRRYSAPKKRSRETDNTKGRAYEGYSEEILQATRLGKRRRSEDSDTEDDMQKEEVTATSRKRRPDEKIDEGADEEMAEWRIDSAPKVAEEDKELYDTIRKKMAETPLEKDSTDTTVSSKRKTDLRRYTELYKFIQSCKTYKEARTALNLFFHKNAPLGYNRHGGEGLVYDVRFERDFTFAQEELSPFLLKRQSRSSSSSVPSREDWPYLEERKNIEYFRASDKHPHILRRQFQNLLRARFKNRFPLKGSSSQQQRNRRKIYISLDVVEEKRGESSQLRIKNVREWFDDPSFFGATRKFPPTIRSKSIDGWKVFLWINTGTAGRHSKYNAAGLVPNLVQYQYIMDQLGLERNKKIKRKVQPEKKSRKFQPATREFVLGETKGEEGLKGNYKARMLEDRRRLIEEVSRMVNDSPAKVCAVTKEQQSDFLQYPCLVLEPLKDPEDPKDPKGTKERKKKELVDNLKKTLTEIVHKNFDISFANRLSFGFAYPTISELGKSVRIWPGLIPASLFKKIIRTVCDVLAPPPSSRSSFSPSTSMPAGVAHSPAFSQSGHPFGASTYTPPDSPSPLAMALITARMRARERFERYDKNKEKIKSKKPLRRMYEWVNNRIVSNLIKANELIRLLAVSPDELQFVVRAVRVLENLNEYDLIQASAEEELWKPTEMKKDEDIKEEGELSDRTENLLKGLKDAVPSQKEGYTLVCVKILNSGMAAYRVALEAIHGAPKRSDKMYFETRKITSAFANETSMGQITRMQDPSYNFVTRREAGTTKKYQPPKTISSSYGRPIYDQERLSMRIPIMRTELPIVHLYDITNTSLDYTFTLATKELPDLVVCYESLSKHFQLGMDKTTLGRLIVYVKDTSRDMANAKNFPALITLAQRFVSIPDTPLPDFFLNYIEMQSRFFGV